MPFRASLPALLLLVLFGLGSIGAPVVHRAAHAAERAHAAHAAHAQADAHVHGVGTVLTGALPALLDLDEGCALCHVHLVSVVGERLDDGQAPREIARASGPARHPAAAPAAHAPARGPPARG